MQCGGRCPRGLKICCSITALLILIFLVTSVILFLTILKPKHPKIISKAVTLEYIKFVPFPFHLNVTLGIVVTIHNPNYGSFKYDNSTVYVSYRGNAAGEGPILHDTVPSRKNHDISTTVVVMVDSFTSNPNFAGDFATGCLNFTSSTTLHGKATALKFLKVKATSHSTCNTSVFFLANNATFVCSTKLHY